MGGKTSVGIPANNAGTGKTGEAGGKRSDVPAKTGVGIDGNLAGNLGDLAGFELDLARLARNLAGNHGTG